MYSSNQKYNSVSGHGQLLSGCAISHVVEDTGLPALDELVSSRLFLEVIRPGIVSAYAFANDMIRDVVYTEAGDARRRLFHRRALDVLEATQESSVVLAHHALAAGLEEAAFRYSLATGQESLRFVAMGDAIVHFAKARQLVREGLLVDAELYDLYSQLAQSYWATITSRF